MAADVAVGVTPLTFRFLPSSDAEYIKIQEGRATSHDGTEHRQDAHKNYLNIMDSF